MRKQPFFERRGTRIYKEVPARKGAAQYVAECRTIDEAQAIVQTINELTEIVNTGLGIDDLIEKDRY